MSSGSHATGAGRSSDKTDHIVCEKRLVTGSHIPREVCSSVEQRETERQDAQNTMQMMRPLSRKIR